MNTNQETVYCLLSTFAQVYAALRAAMGATVFATLDAKKEEDGVFEDLRIEKVY